MLTDNIFSFEQPDPDHKAGKIIAAGENPHDFL